MTEQTVAINEAIENVRKSGPLTPTRLLRVAKHPDSILHPLFEWDDARAGMQEARGKRSRRPRRSTP